MKFRVKKKWFKGVAIVSLLAGSHLTAFAADAAQPSELNNLLALILLAVVVGLLFAIGILAFAVIGAGELYVERFKEKQKIKVNDAVKALSVVALCLVFSSGFAADAPATEAAKEVVVTTIGGLSNSSFYALITVIVLELIVLFTLLF